MENKKQKMKLLFKWGIACLKRSFILLGPMFFMGMFLLDILTQAHFDYPNVPSIGLNGWLECFI